MKSLLLLGNEKYVDETHFYNVEMAQYLWIKGLLGTYDTFYVPSGVNVLDRYNYSFNVVDSINTVYDYIVTDFSKLHYLFDERDSYKKTERVYVVFGNEIADIPNSVEKLKKRVSLNSVVDEFLSNKCVYCVDQKYITSQQVADACRVFRSIGNISLSPYAQYWKHKVKRAGHDFFKKNKYTVLVQSRGVDSMMDISLQDVFDFNDAYNSDEIEFVHIDNVNDVNAHWTYDGFVYANWGNDIHPRLPLEFALLNKPIYIMYYTQNLARMLKTSPIKNIVDHNYERAQQIANKSFRYFCSASNTVYEHNFKHGYMNGIDFSDNFQFTYEITDKIIACGV